MTATASPTSPVIGGDGKAFAVLAAAIMLVPLPFGANTPFWSWLLSASAFALLLVALLRMKAPQRLAATSALRDLRWPLFLFAAASAYILVQTLPAMPTGLAHPVWAELEAAIGTPGWGSISIAPAATLEALAKLLAYVAIFLTALVTCVSPERARLAFKALAVMGAAYAAYGILMEVSGANMVAWMEKDAYEGFVTATFINRNSYAAYAGIGAVCAVSVLTGIILRRQRRHGGPRARRLEAVMMTIFGQGLPWLVAALVILAALMMTGSRGGVVATMAGLVMMAVIWVAAARRRGRFSALFTLAFAGVVLAGVVFAFGRPLLMRFEEKGFDDRAREASTAITLSAIADAPLLGTGFGTFPQAFTLYRTDTLNPAHAYDKAHNTWLENAMELGIPAALVLFASIGIVLLLLARLIFVQQHGHDLLAAALSAVALVSVHSTIDFSLQIPAINATLAFLAGTAVPDAARGLRRPTALWQALPRTTRPRPAVHSEARSCAA